MVIMEQLRHFTILVGNKEIAEEVREELLNKASREAVLKITLEESSFCLGKKVVIDITTDDTKFLNNTRGDIEKWLANGLVFRQGLIFEIEEIADILYTLPKFRIEAN